jgi:hypothetical protein
MAGGGKTGRSLLLLLVLLGGAGGGGAWNYQRNLAKEQSQPRPWRQYSEEELRAMANAYRAEIEQYSKAWQSSRGAQPELREGELIGERVADFEEIQRASSKTRALRSEMADREVVLEQIERELQYKAGERDVMALHLRRLTSFD